MSNELGPSFAGGVWNLSLGNESELLRLPALLSDHHHQTAYPFVLHLRHDTS